MGIGHSEDDEGVGLGRVRDEALRAVEDVVLAGLIELGDRLLAGGVGAGVRLGQAEGAQLAAGQQVGQILHLLLLRAEGIDRIAAQRSVRADDNGRGAADLSNLFNGHRVGEVVAALTTILLGERDTQEAVTGQLGDRLFGEALFLVDFLSQGFHFGLRKFAIHLAEHFVFFTQCKIHSIFSFAAFQEPQSGLAGSRISVVFTSYHI